MNKVNFQESNGEKGIANRLVLGFIATIAATMIGSAGIAAAQSLNDNDQSSDNSSIVTNCKEHYQQYGFSNVGQCVSHLNHHGHGYGGGYGGDGNDNSQGNEDGNGGDFHFHNFFGSWWHRFENDF